MCQIYTRKNNLNYKSIYYNSHRATLEPSSMANYMIDMDVQDFFLDDRYTDRLTNMQRDRQKEAERQTNQQNQLIQNLVNRKSPEQSLTVTRILDLISRNS